MAEGTSSVTGEEAGEHLVNKKGGTSAVWTYFGFAKNDEHTGENIASAIKEILMSWGLCEKNQTCITTDNAANVIKAAELNEWMRLQCFGHRLHLAIGNSVKNEPRVKRATGLCKELVGHFSHSWKKKSKTDGCPERTETSRTLTRH
ncbi:unnamed protein product [Leuciscus chuanchicus]